jgi:hypothetical protein
MDEKVTCEEGQMWRKTGVQDMVEMYAEFRRTFGLHHVPLFPVRYPGAVTI